MSFDTDILADFDALLADATHAESVTYTPDGGAPAAIEAFVTQSFLDSAETIGFNADGKQPPLLVQVSTTDVPTVTKDRDTVLWNSRTYVVKEIIEEDAAARRLYCAQ